MTTLLGRVSRPVIAMPSGSVSASNSFAGSVFGFLFGTLAPPLCALLGLIIPPPAAAQPGPVIDYRYTGDWLVNRRGGLATGGRLMSNVDLVARLPLPALAGSGHTRLLAHGSFNTGKRFSADLVGDFQVASNIEAPRATRLYQLFLEHRSTDKHSSALFGLWDLNSEFDVNAPGDLFLHSAHGIGSEFGTSGKNGPSIFPVAALAARLEHRVGEQLTLRAAVLDAVPGNPQKPAQGNVSLSADEGALLVGEAAFGLSRRWRLKAGAWHYSEPFERFDDPRREAHSSGAYLLAASLKSLLPKNAGGALQAFLRAGLANGEVQRVGAYLGAGVTYAPTADNPLFDRAGIAVAAAFTAQASRPEFARHETAFELTAERQLTPWLRLQPNLQYIVNPGFSPDRNNALVIGLRIELSGQRQLP